MSDIRIGNLMGDLTRDGYNRLRELEDYCEESHKSELAKFNNEIIEKKHNQENSSLTNKSQSSNFSLFGSVIFNINISVADSEKAKNMENLLVGLVNDVK